MAADGAAAAGSRIGSVGYASVVGGLAGAALAGQRGRRSVLAGVAVGAVGLGVSEGVARALQRPGEIPALWQRIAVSSALVAPLGWSAGRFTGAGPVVVGTATGTVAGAMGLRPQKVALGPLVGTAVGLVAAGRAEDAFWVFGLPFLVLHYRIHPKTKSSAL